MESKLESVIPPWTYCPAFGTVKEGERCKGWLEQYTPNAKAMRQEYDCDNCPKSKRKKGEKEGEEIEDHLMKNLRDIVSIF